MAEAVGHFAAVVRCSQAGQYLQARYDEIVNGITPFLKTCGYNPKKDVIFLPMSGLLGHNIKDGVKDVAPWLASDSISSSASLKARSHHPHTHLCA